MRSRVLAAAALFLQGCASTPREPWLTADLTEEFRAARADEVRNFEDYLRLEDRLFAQLEAKVYARTETGSGTALMRYSKGSASDPQGREPNWNRSFELPTEAPVGGVLLLHGMSDSPYSLRALGEELNKRNYWVVGLRLPGHGTAPSGLLDVRWEDMAAAVQLGVEHLAQKVGKQPIHVIGYSTGAPLALDFTLNALDGKTGPVPASLVLVSPAIGIHAAAAAAAWKRRMAVLPGLGNLAWLNIEPEFDPYKYNSFTTNAGEQVHRLTRSVSRRIASQARSQRAGALPPILVFKSNADSTVSTDAVVTRLLGLLDPNRHELVLFDVNRYAAKSMLLVADRRALTNRVMGDNRLPFARNAGHQREPGERRGRGPLPGAILSRSVADGTAEHGMATRRDLAVPRRAAHSAGRSAVRPAAARQPGRALPRPDGHPGRAGHAGASRRMVAAPTEQSVLCLPRRTGAGVDRQRRWARRDRAESSTPPRRAPTQAH